MVGLIEVLSNSYVAYTPFVFWVVSNSVSDITPLQFYGVLVITCCCDVAFWNLE
jgi:hypothetical protein